MTSRAFLAAAALLAAPALAQQPDIRPGLWEFTISQGQGKAMTQQMCFTPQMAKDVKNLATKGEAQGDCKATNEKTSGKTRTFDVACTKPTVYQARISVTMESADSFTMTQDFTAEFNGKKQQGSMKFAYRRIGECKK